MQNALQWYFHNVLSWKYKQVLTIVVLIGDIIGVLLCYSRVLGYLLNEMLSKFSDFDLGVGRFLQITTNFQDSNKKTPNNFILITFYILNICDTTTSELFTYKLNLHRTEATYLNNKVVKQVLNYLHVYNQWSKYPYHIHCFTTVILLVLLCLVILGTNS